MIRYDQDVQQVLRLNVSQLAICAAKIGFHTVSCFSHFYFKAQLASSAKRGTPVVTNSEYLGVACDP